MGKKAIDPKITRQLLALVRSAIWSKTADREAFADGEVDWDALWESASRNTVGILAAQGAFSLPEELQPPKRWTLKSLAYTERNRRIHNLVDGCLGEAVAKLREEGITPVLLKGQAYARQYPDTTMRQCGDIDLYVGENCFDAACATARRHGWEERPGENNNHKAKHFGFYMRGVRIELHRVAAQLSSPVTDRRFDEWSQKQLSTTERTVRIAGEDVSVPTPLFDVVFVFLHLFNHFIGAGVGLRQLCDWVLLLHSHADAFDRNALKTCLNDFGLFYTWQLFSTIAVEHLGLPEEEFPFYTTRYRQRAEKVLDSVIRGGNFGWYAWRPMDFPANYWHKKLYSFIRYQRVLLSRLWIAPRYITMTSVSFIYRGCRQVLVDKLHGRKR